jgi:uncharacterized protein YjbI with pentapeptide repeats
MSVLSSAYLATADFQNADLRGAVLLRAVLVEVISNSQNWEERSLDEILEDYLYGVSRPPDTVRTVNFRGAQMSGTTMPGGSVKP